MTKYTDPAESEEESLNSILKKIDEDLYFEGCNKDFYDKDQTAYDVIARINNLHCVRLNIYKNPAGHSYIRTALGFQPVIVYNQGLTITELQSELHNRDKTIVDLKITNEKMVNVLTDERSISAALREKISKPTLDLYLKRIQLKVTKRTIKNLDNILRMIRSIVP
jgi:hypothetical protein